jgi:hypothetical protein
MTVAKRRAAVLRDPLLLLMILPPILFVRIGRICPLLNTISALGRVDIQGDISGGIARF